MTARDVRIIVTLVVLLLLVGVAQLNAQIAHGQTYVIAGPGRFGDDNMGYAAWGGEYVGGAVGVGGEVGRLFGARPDAPGGPTRSTMVVGFHIVVPLVRSLKPPMRVQPFFHGGLGFLRHAIGDSSLAYVFGGGANIWATKRVALRTEIRVPVGFSSNGGWTGGLGLTLR